MSGKSVFSAGSPLTRCRRSRAECESVPVWRKGDHEVPLSTRSWVENLKDLGSEGALLDSGFAWLEFGATQTRIRHKWRRLERRDKSFWCSLIELRLRW